MKNHTTKIQLNGICRNAYHFRIFFILILLVAVATPHLLSQRRAALTLDSGVGQGVIIVSEQTSNLSGWRLINNFGNERDGVAISTEEFGPWNDNELSLGTSGFRWTEIFVVNDVINTSDRRLKNNIKELDYGTDEIMKLNPVTYSWKNDNTQETRIGFIAQEVYKVIPEAVVINKAGGESRESPNTKKDPGSWHGMRTSYLVPVLVAGMKELISENEKLEVKLSEFEKRFSELEKTILFNQND